MVELECVMDYSSEFTTYEIFKSREALCKWTREVGKRNGLVVVIKKSDVGGNGRRPRILFGCERGGHHRNTDKNIEAQSEKRPKRQSGTKKCGCPFSLKGQKLSNDDDWMLEVVCGVHNHLAAEHLEGHSYAGRLSQDETSLLVDMSKSMVRPKEILVTLKQKDALNATTMKTIYNARHRYKVTKKVGRPQKQHLMDISAMIEKMVGDDDKHVTRVLFCGPHFPASQNYTREYLQNYPFIQVDDVPLGDVPDVIANYHICIVKSMKLDSNIISRANQMKLIMQYGVGLEGVDIGAATKCGIKVARIPSDITGNAASCAEMAIYLILGLLRKQNEMQIAVRQKKLGEPVGETLLGKTVFILGFGNIGIELAKRLRPFGVRILATKRNWASHSQYSCQSEAFPIQNGVIADLVDGKGGQEDLYEFASKADIVVCCLHMNSETAGIVNKRFISSMKKGALLVNIARGGLLDYEAVACHLESGHLGGLGIDVAWTEPFDPDDPILKFQNVLITPHVAGVTEFSYRSMSKVVGDVALQLHGGTPLTGIEFVN